MSKKWYIETFVFLLSKKIEYCVEFDCLNIYITSDISSPDNRVAIYRDSIYVFADGKCSSLRFYDYDMKTFIVREEDEGYSTNNTFILIDEDNIEKLVKDIRKELMEVILE